MRGRGAPARHSTPPDHPPRHPLHARAQAPGANLVAARPQAAAGCVGRLAAGRSGGGPRVTPRSCAAGAVPPGAMAGATDPFYLVKDDIHASVRAAGLPTGPCMVPASQCRAGPLSRNPGMGIVLR